jgi:hypothetical protein
MINAWHWIQANWIVMWLVAIKVLTVFQDAVDAEPAGLKPPFGKLLYYTSAIGQSLTIGNRPTAITPTKGV